MHGFSRNSFVGPATKSEIFVIKRKKPRKKVVNRVRSSDNSSKLPNFFVTKPLKMTT